MSNDLSTEVQAESPTSLIPVLTSDKRQEAREKAKAMILRQAGPQPKREKFENRRVSPYPVWVTGISLTGLLLLFVFTFIPSMFRLFTAGRDHFLAVIPDPHQAAAVGLSIFVMAELAVILATIVQKVYFPENNRSLNAAVAIGVITAMSGNIVINQPPFALSAEAVFRWIETIGPPIIVLSTSVILKQIMFTSIEHRMKNEADYQEALRKWEEETANPENHKNFYREYGNQIKDAIYSTYVVGSKAKERREYLNQLSHKDWIDLFLREMRQDHWVPDANKVDSWINAQSQVEVGSNPTPLQPTPQPTYGFHKPTQGD